MDVSPIEIHPLSTAEVRCQLERMLHAVEFAVRPRAAHMLRFFVEESLRNGFEPIAQRVIATRALGLDETFNPSQSGYVRVNVSRLHAAIELYFAGSGRHDPVVFELTPGPYRIRAMRTTRIVPDDLPPQPAREIRRRLPLLLLVEPDGRELDDDADRPLGPRVGLRVSSQFAESTLVIVSGPLSRDRLTELRTDGHGDPRSVATIAGTLGYDYVADPVLGTADGRWCPRLSVIDTGNGEVIKFATDSLGPFPNMDEAAQDIATWIVAAINECFFAPPPPAAGPGFRA